MSLQLYVCVFKTEKLTRLRLRLLVSHMDDGATVAALGGDGHNALSLAGQGEGRQGASHHCGSISRLTFLKCFHVWQARLFV